MKAIYLFLFNLLIAQMCIAEVVKPTTIIVTCASGELGSAIAKLLAQDHDLILTGRDLTKLQQLQGELRKRTRTTIKFFQ